MATLHVIVEGRVQGVGFRWFVRQRARAQDLAGWVRNLENGSVEVAAEGSPDGIGRLRRELRRGPEGAWVEEVRDVPSGDDPPALTRPFAIIR